MCQKIDHRIIGFKAEHLLSICDRVEGENHKTLDPKMVQQIADDCEKGGPAFTLVCGDEIIACGGFFFVTGDMDYWLGWLSVSEIAEHHKMTLHKAAISIFRMFAPRLRGLPIFTTIRDDIRRNTRWAAHLGFRRCGDTEVEPFGTGQYSLYALERN
jgi:hypothetical protein